MQPNLCTSEYVSIQLYPIRLSGREAPINMWAFSSNQVHQRVIYTAYCHEILLPYFFQTSIIHQWSVPKWRDKPRAQAPRIPKGFFQPKVAAIQCNISDLQCPNLICALHISLCAKTFPWTVYIFCVFIIICFSSLVHEFILLSSYNLVDIDIWLVITSLPNTDLFKY